MLCTGGYPLLGPKQLNCEHKSYYFYSDAQMRCVFVHPIFISVKCPFAAICCDTEVEVKQHFESKSKMISDAIAVKKRAH